MLVVCDATCLERGLSLALQVLEITSRAVVCVNLLDEARRKGIHVRLEELSRLLGVAVVGCAATQRQGAASSARGPGQSRWRGGGQAPASRKVSRPGRKRRSPDQSPAAPSREGQSPMARPAAAGGGGGGCLLSGSSLASGGRRERPPQWFSDAIAGALARRAGELARRAVSGLDRGYSVQDKRLDRILTGRWTAFPRNGPACWWGCCG